MKPRFKFDAWKEALRLLADCNHPSQIRINLRLALPRPYPLHENSRTETTDDFV